MLREREKTVRILARRRDKIQSSTSRVTLILSIPRKCVNRCCARFATFAPRVVVNLGQVRYIDSSGVASLLEGLKASRDFGSRFILIGLSSRAREVLRLTRLITLFEIYDNEEQALAP